MRTRGKTLGTPIFCRNSRFALSTLALLEGYLIVQGEMLFDRIRQTSFTALHVDEIEQPNKFAVINIDP